MSLTLPTAGRRQRLPGIIARETAVEFSPRVSRGLVGLFFPRKSAARAANNFGRGLPAASIVGTPTYADDYARLTGNANYLQTGVVDSAAFTWVVTGRYSGDYSTNAKRPIMVSSSSGKALANPARSASGHTLWTTSTPSIAFTANRWDGSLNAPLNLTLTGTPAATTNFMTLAARQDATNMKLQSLTHGLSTSLTSAYTPDPTDKPLMIGTTTSSSYQGWGEMAMVSLYNVMLTDDELAAVYADHQAYMALLGVTV